MLAGARVERRSTQVTRGNPFLVTEMLAAQQTTVPATVRDAVLVRVMQLDAPARDVVELVSVVPSRIETAVLDRLHEHWERDAEEPESRGLLQLDGRSLSFRHELARRAVMTALPQPRARALHRRVLQALRERAAPTLHGSSITPTPQTRWTRS